MRSAQGPFWRCLLHGQLEPAHPFGLPEPCDRVGTGTALKARIPIFHARLCARSAEAARPPAEGPRRSPPDIRNPRKPLPRHQTARTQAISVLSATRSCRNSPLQELSHSGGLNGKNQKCRVVIGSSPDRIAPPVFKTRPDVQSLALRALRAKAAGCATRPAPKIAPGTRRETAMKQEILN